MSKILLSVPGHYFIFFKNQPLPFHFSPAQHSIRKGHLKNSGCSHHTCNGRGQASAEPTEVPGFSNYFRILQLVVQVAFANWVAPQPSGEADVGHCHLVLPRTKRTLSILRNGSVIFIHIFSLYGKCVYVTVLNQHLLPVPSVSQLS